MSRSIKFSIQKPGGNRIHYVSESDVRVVLSRLPAELYQRLRSVHFNDRSWGGRTLGYVGHGRHDIALCALPARVTLTRACAAYGTIPEQFGAIPGRKWPALAVRRLMLYDVFLHELGHLQLIDSNEPRSGRLRFARETSAEEFATDWRGQLWSEEFVHPDPVHNVPRAEEFLTSAVLKNTASMEC